MKNASGFCCFGLVMGMTLAIAAIPVSAQTPEFSLATTFTYQGRLQQHGLPADGVFDLTFDLWDAPADGSFLGRVDRFDVQVRSGLFAVELDFGDRLTGEASAWLEIQVRLVGGGDYTTLHPRQKTLGDTCVVNSDVEINGNLALGSSNGLLIGNPITGLNIDRDEIWIEGLATPSLLINARGGGKLGVGRANAQAPLHVAGSPDVSPGGGGALVVGSTNGANIGIDSNEIMARSNGVTSTLYLNNNGGDVVVGGTLNSGGDVVVGGTLDIGLEIVSHQENNDSVTVHCAPGKTVIGGGCVGAGTDVQATYPSGTNQGWVCWFSSAEMSNTAHAYCADVR